MKRPAILPAPPPAKAAILRVDAVIGGQHADLIVGVMLPERISWMPDLLADVLGTHPSLDAAPIYLADPRRGLPDDGSILAEPTGVEYARRRVKLDARPGALLNLAAFRLSAATYHDRGPSRLALVHEGVALAVAALGWERGRS